MTGMNLAKRISALAVVASAVFACSPQYARSAEASTPTAAVALRTTEGDLHRTADLARETTRSAVQRSEQAPRSTIDSAEDATRSAGRAVESALSDAGDATGRALSRAGGAVDSALNTAGSATRRAIDAVEGVNSAEAARNMGDADIYVTEKRILDEQYRMERERYQANLRDIDERLQKTGIGNAEKQRLETQRKTLTERHARIKDEYDASVRALGKDRNLSEYGRPENARLETRYGNDELRYQADLKAIDERLKNPNLGAAEKQRLERQKATLTDNYARRNDGYAASAREAAWNRNSVDPAESVKARLEAQYKQNVKRYQADLEAIDRRLDATNLAAAEKQLLEQQKKTLTDDLARAKEDYVASLKAAGESGVIATVESEWQAFSARHLE